MGQQTSSLGSPKSIPVGQMFLLRHSVEAKEIVASWIPESHGERPPAPPFLSTHPSLLTATHITLQTVFGTEKKSLHNQALVCPSSLEAVPYLKQPQRNDQTSPGGSCGSRSMTSKNSSRESIQSPSMSKVPCFAVDWCLVHSGRSC